MTNIETLTESIYQQINDTALQSTNCFSKLESKFAYSQLNLNPETANRCTFNLLSRDITGINLNQTGTYGLTDMPAEFQKVMDYTFIGLENIYLFR